MIVVAFRRLILSQVRTEFLWQFTHKPCTKRTAAPSLFASSQRIPCHSAISQRLLFILLTFAQQSLLSYAWSHRSFDLAFGNNSSVNPHNDEADQEDSKEQGQE